jgi:O-antigen/teichoic acid export membrane protein
MHHIISFLLIFLALGMIGGKDIIYLILVDKQYWASRLIMPLLLVSPVCDTISETLGLGIELSKKTYLKLPVYCVNIMVNLGACLILIPRMGVIGAAISNALASLSMLIVKSVIGEKYYKCSNDYFRLIVGMVSFLMVAILNIVIDLLFVRIFIVLIATIILCIVYHETIKDLVNIAQRMLSEKLQKRNK